MALVLSHMFGIGSFKYTLISFKICFIRIIFEKQVVNALFSALTVDKEMEGYFILTHDIKQFPKKNVAPEVLFLSSILPTQSTLV